MDSIKNKSVINMRPKILWFLIMTYTVIIVLSNWFDPRIIGLPYGLSTDAGTIIFPFTFLLSDLITEVYGYKFARLAVWCGFGFNWLFLAYGQIIIHLPTPDFAVHSNEIFGELLGTSLRIICASTASYLIAEPLNSYVMSKMKILHSGNMMGVRFVSSTVVASFLDSNIFGFLAFYGVMPTKDLIVFNMTMWGVKVIIEVVGLPFSVAIAKKLKRIERSDMYDFNTNFNIFRLDTHYDEKANKYNQ